MIALPSLADGQTDRTRRGIPRLRTQHGRTVLIRMPKENQMSTRTAPSVSPSLLRQTARCHDLVRRAVAHRDERDVPRLGAAVLVAVPVPRVAACRPPRYDRQPARLWRHMPLKSDDDVDAVAPRLVACGRCGVRVDQVT